MKTELIIFYALVGIASVMISSTLQDTTSNILDKMTCSPTCELKAEQLVCEGNKTADHLREILECVTEIPPITVLVLRVSHLKCTCQWFHFANSIVDRKVHLITTPTVKTCLEKGSAICPNHPTPVGEDAHDHDYPILQSAPETVPAKGGELGSSHWDSILGDTEDWVAIKKLHDVPAKEKSYDDLKTDDLIYIIIILVSVMTPVVCGLVFLVLYKMKKNNFKKRPDDEKPREKKHKTDIFNIFKKKKPGKTEFGVKQAKDKVPLLDQTGNDKRTKEETANLNKKVLSQVKTKGGDTDYVAKVNKIFGEDWKQFPTYGPGTFPNTDNAEGRNNNNVERKLLLSEDTDSESSDDLYNLWSSPANSIKGVNRSFNNRQAASSHPSETDVSLLHSESSALPCTSFSERSLPDFVALEDKQIHRHRSQILEEGLSQTSDTDLTDMPGFSRQQRHKILLPHPKTRSLKNKTAKKFPAERVSRILVTSSYFSPASSDDETSSAKEVFLREIKSGSLLTSSSFNPTTNDNAGANSRDGELRQNVMRYDLAKKPNNLSGVNSRLSPQTSSIRAGMIAPSKTQNNTCLPSEHCLEYNLNAEPTNLRRYSPNNESGNSNETHLSFPQTTLSFDSKPVIDTVPTFRRSCKKKGYIGPPSDNSALSGPTVTDVPYRLVDRQHFSDKRDLLQTPEKSDSCDIRQEKLSYPFNPNADTLTTNCPVPHTRMTHDTGVETGPNSSHTTGKSVDVFTKTNSVLQTFMAPDFGIDKVGASSIEHINQKNTHSSLSPFSDRVNVMNQPAQKNETSSSNRLSRYVASSDVRASLHKSNCTRSNIPLRDKVDSFLEQDVKSVENVSTGSGHSIEQPLTPDESAHPVDYLSPNSLTPPAYLERSPAVSQYLCHKPFSGRFFKDLGENMNCEEVVIGRFSLFNGTSDAKPALPTPTSKSYCIPISQENLSNRFKPISSPFECKSPSTIAFDNTSNPRFVPAATPINVLLENNLTSPQFHDTPGVCKSVNGGENCDSEFVNTKSSYLEELNSSESDIVLKHQDEGQHLNIYSSSRTEINEMSEAICPVPEGSRPLLGLIDMESFHKTNDSLYMKSNGFCSDQSSGNKDKCANTCTSLITRGDLTDTDLSTCLNVENVHGGNNIQAASTLPHGLTFSEEEADLSDYSDFLDEDSLLTDLSGAENNVICNSISNQMTHNPDIISTEHSLTNVTNLSSICNSLPIFDSLLAEQLVACEESLTDVSRLSNLSPSPQQLKACEESLSAVSKCPSLSPQQLKACEESLANVPKCASASVIAAGLFTPAYNSADDIQTNTTKDQLSPVNANLDSNFSGLFTSREDDIDEDSCLLRYNMSD